MPKVSVVVPNYNHARFLKQRLDSVLDQTYRDFELIYLDDASTDDSAAVFAPYASHPQVRAVLNDANTGSPFVQWNRGVREARGEYVWIAEADDSADPRLLETLVRALDAHPSVGVAYCQSLRVDPEGKILGSCVEWTRDIDPHRWDTDFVADGRAECEQYLAQTCTIYNASAVLFRKSDYDAVGGADEALRQCADWRLWLALLERSDLAFVAEPLNFFRQHPQSVTGRSRRSGVYARESYATLQYTLTHFNVAPAVAERARDIRAERWAEVFLRLSWGQNRAIAQLARTVDPRAWQRIAHEVFKRVLRPVVHALRRP